MPSYMFGAYLDTLIGVHFPGGLLGFAKAGCDAVSIPVPGEKDIAYILIPEQVSRDLDLEPFKEKIKKACEDKRVRLHIVDSSVYEGASPSELKDRLMPLIWGLAQAGLECHVSCHPAVFVIDAQINRDEAEQLLNLIGASGVIKRALIVMTVGSVGREYDLKEEPVFEPAPEVNSVIEVSTHDRVITKDEVTDLKILLESTGTVEDFLNSI